MAHMWDKGILTASSWHGLEEIVTFNGAADMILKGERCGAWPVRLRTESLFTADGLEAPRSGIVAEYAEGTRKPQVLGVNGDRYNATTPGAWRDLVRAAVKAGALPTGAFSLEGGSRVLATFEVGKSNGLRTQFILVDSFDGSIKLTAGFTTVRVVCANTLSMALSSDGKGMAALRHTASLDSKVKILEETIGKAILTGEKVKETFAKACDVKLSREAARVAFDALFPEAPEGATGNAKTRAENARHDARRAAAMPINRVGETAGNLGTLWNAATYLVDRTADGAFRKTKGDSDALNSLLFGTRADRVQEIQNTIEVIMRDGSVEKMTATQAKEAGVNILDLVDMG